MQTIDIQFDNLTGKVHIYWISKKVVMFAICKCIYSKTYLKRLLEKDKTKILMTNGSLIKVERILLTCIMQ